MSSCLGRCMVALVQGKSQSLVCLRERVALCHISSVLFLFFFPIAHWLSFTGKGRVRSRLHCLFCFSANWKIQPFVAAGFQEPNLMASVWILPRQPLCNGVKVKVGQPYLRALLRIKGSHIVCGPRTQLKKGWCTTLCTHRCCWGWGFRAGLGRSCLPVPSPLQKPLPGSSLERHRDKKQAPSFLWFHKLKLFLCSVIITCLL